jgi:hypothetical protein
MSGIPGFTAEASLAKTNRRHALRRIHSRQGRGVEPQALRCMIDHDATAANGGNIVLTCVIEYDGREIYPPIKTLM